MEAGVQRPIKEKSESQHQDKRKNLEEGTKKKKKGKAWCFRFWGFLKRVWFHFF